MGDVAKILYCHCAYAQVVPLETKREVLRRLAESGVAFDAVADLCEMSAKRDPLLGQLVEGGAVRIAACYPRAVKWLFNAADVPYDESLVQIGNMRTQQPEDIVELMLNGTPIPVPAPAEVPAEVPA